MIKSFSNKILQYLVKTGTIDKDEDVLAYYRYGLEITFSSIVNIILILLIGICSHHFYGWLFFSWGESSKGAELRAGYGQAGRRKLGSCMMDDSVGNRRFAAVTKRVYQGLWTIFSSDALFHIHPNRYILHFK